MSENFTRLMLAGAYRKATESPDPSSQNGAVAVRNGRAVGWGCNTFPEGVEHRAERWERPRKYEFVVHAEMAAVLDALTRAERPDTLYCPWIACANCAKHLIAAGVRRVVGHLQLSEQSDAAASWSKQRLLGVAMLKEAGVEVDFYDGPVSGPYIRFLGRLFDPETGEESRMLDQEQPYIPPDPWGRR